MTMGGHVAMSPLAMPLFIYVCNYVVLQCVKSRRL